MRVHKLIVKCDQVLYRTITGVFQYLVKPSTVKHQIFDTRFSIFHVYILTTMVRIHLDTCVKGLYFNFWSLETLTSDAFLMDTKGRGRWALKMSSGISSFSTYIVKMLWWPNVDNLSSSWWVVSTCACFWGQKGSMLCIIIPPIRRKVGTCCGTPSASAPRFFSQEKPWCKRYRGKIQCHIVRMQLLDA